MNGKKYLAGAATLAVVLIFAACGKSSSPTSPSSPAGSSKSGASITGIVSGTAGGSATGYTKLDNSSGVTVTIAGTNLTVAVDASGKFVFTGVPAGTVQLVFTSGGVTSTITLEGVKETDTITVKVTIKGTTASLDTEERNGATVTELEDRIAAINPGGTTRTLLLGSTTVSIPAGITIRHGGTAVPFENLKVGDRLHVRGALSGALFVATEVVVQNTNDNVPVNASGTVTDVPTGACPTVHFTVAGWGVDTNGSTDFQKGSCSAVVKGASVHIKGDVQQPSGRVLASWVQIGK